MAAPFDLLHKSIRGASREAVHTGVRRHLSYITGLENIPTHGPVVLVANHSSYADHYFILTIIDAVRGRGLGANTWFPTKAESFQGTLSKRWHDAWFCYPVNRDAPSQEVFTKAQRILDQGAVLCLYPEGTRGPGGRLLPLKSGAFRMALAAGAPVIPIGLGNLHRVLPKGSSYPSRENGYAVIGEPLTMPESLSDLRAASSNMRDEARDRIEQLIAQGAVESSNPETVASAAASIASMVNRRLINTMTDDGRVDSTTARSSAELAALGLRMAPNDVDLQLQLARSHALAAMNQPIPVRLARLTHIARTVRRIVAEHPDNAFANYFAGALHGELPAWAGGSRDAAMTFYTRAAQDTTLASRSLVSLAKLQIAGGDHAAALASLTAAEHAIAPTDSRKEIRLARIEKLREQLTAA